MIPYRQPSARQMDYGQLMQLLQMKQMMDAQQGQQQPEAPSTSGISDLLQSFGGGSGGAAATNSLGASGGGSLANSVFGAGGGSSAQVLAPNAPGYMSGFDISAGAAVPESSALASVGVPAAVIAATVLGGRSGLNMLKGKQKNWKDASLADNAGRVALAGATGGLSEVANKFFGGHKSTKDRQAGKWNELVKSGKAPEWFTSSPVNQDQGIDDNKLASGKLGGRDVWATSAFFDKFGSKDKTWDKTGTEQQREQIAKEILDNKLLDTRKGVSRFTDDNKAMDIYNRVLGNKSPSATPLQNLPVVKGPAMLDPKSVGNISNAPELSGMDDFIKQHGATQYQPAPIAQAPAGTPSWQNATPARTDTPGFKNGKRIDYNRR